MIRVSLVLFFFSLLLNKEALANYKDFVVGLPVFSMGGEAVTKIEYNLSGSGSIGLEVILIQEGEQFTEEEAEANGGDSFLMKGAEVGLTFSSYSDGKLMAGGYWTLGLGYRQVQADWLRSPSEAFSPQGVSLNEDGKFTHEVISAGATARARIGYRYVAESMPFAIGAYIGVRHFENSFEDRESDEAVETPVEDSESLSRRFMSSIEPGIEIGMSF